VAAHQGPCANPENKTHLFNPARGLTGLNAGCFRMSTGERINGALPPAAAGLPAVCGAAKRSLPSPNEELVDTIFKSCESMPEQRCGTVRAENV
jgi:hypothetical protein